MYLAAAGSSFRTNVMCCLGSDDCDQATRPHKTPATNALHCAHTSSTCASPFIEHARYLAAQSRCLQAQSNDSGVGKTTDKAEGRSEGGRPTTLGHCRLPRLGETLVRRRRHSLRRVADLLSPDQSRLPHSSFTYRHYQSIT